jgi:hypothetical protein
VRRRGIDGAGSANPPPGDRRIRSGFPDVADAIVDPGADGAHRTMNEHALLIANVASTLMLTGLIWFVQVVHYPLMGWVGAEAFRAHHAQHVRRTSLVVGPLMLAEAVAAVLLAVGPLGDAAPAMVWTGVALVAAIWLSTAFVQVPCHRGLEAGYDQRLVRRLVATNWLRTVAWTARSVLALVMIAAAGGA